MGLKEIRVIMKQFWRGNAQTEGPRLCIYIFEIFATKIYLC